MTGRDVTLVLSAPLQSGDGDGGGLYQTGAVTRVLSAVNLYRDRPSIVNAVILDLDASLIKTDGATMTPSNITVDSGATLASTFTTASFQANGPAGKPQQKSFS